VLEFGNNPQNPQRRVPRQPSQRLQTLADAPRRRPGKPRSGLQRFLGKLFQSDRPRESQRESSRESLRESRLEPKTEPQRPTRRPVEGRPTAVELPTLRTGQPTSSRSGIKPFAATGDRPMSRRQIPTKQNFLASLLPRSRNSGTASGATHSGTTHSGTTHSGTTKVTPLRRPVEPGDGRFDGRSRSQQSTPLQSRSQSQPLRSGQSNPVNPNVDLHPDLVQPHRTRRSPVHRQPARPVPVWVQGVRLLIVGVGLGAIAGTTMGLLEPSLKKRPATVRTAAIASNVSGQALASSTVVLKTSQELTELAAKLGAIAQETKDLTPGVFVADPVTGEYASYNGSNVFSAASTIKVPLLIAFLQDVDAGKIRLDEVMTMQADDKAEGSGDLQYTEVGSKYQALDVATLMIINSDNTATNMVIRRLGGIDAINQRFKQWGLQQTMLGNRLPDVEGTNTTSPQELTSMLATVSQGGLLSMNSRDRLISIMRNTINDTLLPQTLGDGALIAHKTGDIGAMLGDTGIVDLPNGKRYLVSVMVKRPHNDERAGELIHRLSAEVYQRFAVSKTADKSAPATQPKP
jgi:beta-lactamase class A